MIIVWNIFFGKFRGITLFPFIIVKDKQSKEDYELINHEKIHIQQQKEMLVIFFYLWYGIEWIIERIKFGKKAYRMNSFEMEAYENMKNLDYLRTRKRFAWFKYL